MTAIGGRIGWLELNAQRVTAAATFYAQLFAWEMRPLHVAPWGALPLMAHGGRVFANQFMAMGAFAVPHWKTYIVADLDIAATRTEALGAPAPDRSEIPGNGQRLDGRDPQGTPYGLIAPAFEMPADDRPGEPWGAELWASEGADMGAVFAALLGLASRRVGDTVLLGHPARLCLRSTPFAVVPPRWVPLFRSASVGADQERARRLGAIVQVPDESVEGFGRRAILADPAGAAFGLIEPA